MTQRQTRPQRLTSLINAVRDPETLVEELEKLSNEEDQFTEDLHHKALDALPGIIQQFDPEFHNAKQFLDHIDAAADATADAAADDLTTPAERAHAVDNARNGLYIDYIDNLIRLVDAATRARNLLVFYLFHDGMPQTEISKQLGLPRTTIASWLKSGEDTLDSSSST